MKYPKGQILLLILIWIFFSFANSLVAQCPDRPGKPVLKDQVAVDSFLAIYPNCTNYIEGTMSVNGVPIYWVYEDVRGYLLTLGGLVLVILGLLNLIFKRMEWFQK